MTRKPFVAGQFYPGRPRELREALDLMTDPAAAKGEADRRRIAARRVRLFRARSPEPCSPPSSIPDTVIILGPGHRPIRPVFAVQSEGTWETPLGAVPIESDLAKALLDACPLCRSDAKAHEQEHSLEVQVPFLQHFRPGVSIVPVCVSSAAAYADLEGLGKAMAGIRTRIRRAPCSSWPAPT